MKFLLDVCAASRSMHSMLTEGGHDVLSALEENPRAADEELLALAMEENRILITEDKDFGELVFVRRLPRPCIIRFVEMQVAEKVTAMRELIESHTHVMHEGTLIVVTRNRVRVRLARIHRWTGMDGVRAAEGGEGVTGAMIRGLEFG